VRQAISKALDRSYLIETSLSTSAQPSNLPVHPDFSLLSTPSVETRDLQTAQQLLTDAGLTGEGTSLSLTLLYSTDGADRAQTANQIAAQLSGHHGHAGRQGAGGILRGPGIRLL